MVVEWLCWGWLPAPRAPPVPAAQIVVTCKGSHASKTLDPGDELDAGAPTAAQNRRTAERHRWFPDRLQYQSRALPLQSSHSKTPRAASCELLMRQQSADTSSKELLMQPKGTSC